MHSPPSFTIGSSSKSLFTVIISSLDSNVVENGKNELLHYAVSNLSNEDEKGQTWMDYMQPIPAKGSGYHRLVATLYHQTDRLEVEKLSGCLSGRQFDSAEYLAANQDVLTPAGFCFSQVYLVFNFLDLSSSIDHARQVATKRPIWRIVPIATFQIDAFILTDHIDWP